MATASRMQYMVQSGKKNAYFVTKKCFRFFVLFTFGALGVESPPPHPGGAMFLSVLGFFFQLYNLPLVRPLYYSPTLLGSVAGMILRRMLINRV